MEAETARRGAHVAAADTRFMLGGGLLGRLGRAGIDRALDAIDRGLAEGRLELVCPDGSVRHLGGRAPGPDAQITLVNWRPLIRLATGGSAGFSRSHFDGDWSSPDPVAIFELFMLNRVPLGSIGRGGVMARLFNWAARAAQANTREGSKRNIAFHYDLGNDFYSAWLDPTMTYSSAVFADENEPLEEAQKRKVRLLLDSIGVRPGEHILEIGCGWGGLAEIAAAERGAHVTGITLSREQLDFARARIARAGLSDRVTLELRDYRDVEGRFDHVASVEMFEAVGERYWRTFMDAVARALKPGGRAAIQVITIDEAIFEAYRRGADFIQTYIFPGGILPSEPRFRAAAEAAGLRWEGSKPFGQHYARTLRQWRERFDAARNEGRLPAGFDERFAKIWRYYLMYCEGGFRSGGIDVIQATLART